MLFNTGSTIRSLFQSMAKIFSDEQKLRESAAEIASKSNGLMWGAVGAIDGWLVKIKKSTLKRDHVKNPASFYSREGFFGINVQVVVDRKSG